MKRKKKMDGPDSEIAACVIAEVARGLGVRDFVEAEDDDVFVDHMPDGDVYSDICSNYARTPQPQTAEDARRALSNQTRTRHTSDVIDSLGEELVTMRVHGSSDPYSIPVSPRTRISSDLGYSGSFASSPAHTHFNFPNGMTGVTCSVGSRRSYNNLTDSRPIEYSDEKECKEVPETLEVPMPVPRDADTYNMQHTRRGHAIIFNNDRFDNNMASPRKGSLVDVACLEQTFHALGFQVNIYHNLTHYEIKGIVNEMSQHDHSDADCIALAVLTHGMDNGYLYARDALYPVEALWKPFTADRCLSLAGKPKLFFIQACRGDKLDGGVSLVSQRRSVTETDTGCASYKIPSFSDFLISFSSMDGFYSWRNPEDGTWFIQSLGLELRTHGASRNLLDILTRVHRRVALQFESNVADAIWMNGQKQCPVYHSSLMRDLVFLPKK